MSAPKQRVKLSDKLHRDNPLAAMKGNAWNKVRPEAEMSGRGMLERDVRAGMLEKVVRVATVMKMLHYL